MPTKVSIGIFEVTKDSIQTDQEIIERAALAKKFAKRDTKYYVATYKDQGFTDEDVYAIG